MGWHLVIAWLGARTPFPPPDRALAEPNGLLAAGGDLSRWRLMEAYRQGIFPWFSDGQPPLWWCPDPRMVLFVDRFKISRSLSKTLRNGRYEIRMDQAFDAVVEACGAPRAGVPGTWITPALARAYGELHRRGHAHSVETYYDDRLVGGLYGVSVGLMFFGESMFSIMTDASKVALAHLVGYLRTHGGRLIDCQMNTAHLASLGACEIPRAEFTCHLAELINSEPFPIRWDHASVPFLPSAQPNGLIE